jgi:hypothetical protein
MDTKTAYLGGIVRILTTLVGGWLAQKGLSTEAEVEGIAGAVVLVGTGLWSIWAKRKALLAKPPKGMLVAVALLTMALASGCAVVSGRAGDSRYTGFALGEKASSTLAGLNVTETQTEGGAVTLERGVGVDTAGTQGEADMGKLLGNLLLLGLQSRGIPAGEVNGEPSAVNGGRGEVNGEPSAVNGGDVERVAVGSGSSSGNAGEGSGGESDVSDDGYGGIPGAGKEGVYGRPGCSRCQAYRAAHPETEMINIETAGNRADMWAALRQRKYKAATVALPVLVTADGWTAPAR